MYGAGERGAIMKLEFNPGRDSVVVLLKGGRLPSWGKLSEEERRTSSQEHVDLMLGIGNEFGLMRLEGFKLIGPQGDWERFWLIEFPSLEGAEAWIEAEMAPSYGLYGYYEYFLSRRYAIDSISTMPAQPSTPGAVSPRPNPANIPKLAEDRSSVVVLLFERWHPGAEAVPPGERGEDAHLELMSSLAGEQSLMRLDAFQLIDRQNTWHRVVVAEFHNFTAAEIFINAAMDLPRSLYASTTFYLARRWAPEYFSSWVSPH